MHFWGVDAVLCKTNECYDRVTKWFEQKGNLRKAKVFYTKHTSTDPGLFTRKRLGEYAVVPKDFYDVKFVHTAGTSSAKGTREVVECWTYTRDLPPLDVYIERKPFYRLFPTSYKMKIARSLSPVNIHLGKMNRLNYSKVVADASFIVNPSYSEGYGHIINQARASGAVLVTTDVPPMNELIIANETGVLVSVKREKHPMVMLGGKYKGDHGLENVGGLVASFQSSDVCEAIQRMIRSTSSGERAEMGFHARRQYHADTKYFANAMEETGQPQVSRIRQRELHRFLVFLVTLGVFTVVLESSSLLRNLERQLLPNLSGFAGNSNGVSDEDLLHLSLLHEHCVADANGLLSWEFGSPGNQLPNASASNPEVVMRQNDPDLLQKLRPCPDVDIFLPAILHGNGYCEDAVAYAKCLRNWVLEVKLYDPDLGRLVDYFDLCPKTPMIFFNHYWEDVPYMPRWPENKPIYLMPNIEMYELTAEHYWNVDVVLCKTKECYDRVTRWYEQEGNPRNTSVFYTKHTSSDQAHFARKRLGEEAIAPKNFSNITFTHTAGSSAWKGTRELLECWVFNTELPPLNVYIDHKPFNRLVAPKLKSMLNQSRSPVNIHVGLIERSAFTKLTAEASFFMCPSTMEGYGHYINQARASGAVIVTTDISPMNELITQNESGLLIPVQRKKNTGAMLGGAYRGLHGLKGVDGLYASFGGPKVCEVVRQLVNSTTTERVMMAANARRMYLEDTKYFANAMQELREFVNRNRSQVTTSMSKEQLTTRSRLTRAFGLRGSWHKNNDTIPAPLADAGDPKEVTDEDLLHLSLLHEHCVADANGSLPWEFGSPGNQLPNASASNSEVVMRQNDPDLLQKLRQCPDIFFYQKIYTAMAIAKMLWPMQSWVLEVKLYDPDLGRTVDYFDLCPKTPMIFFNHYWEDVPYMPRWPENKPIYLMPNIEMFELTPTHYWNVDVVLCKTKECYDRVTRWYEQEGNPRKTSVFYTKHTSSDQAHFARKRLGEEAIAPKDFSNIKFIHTAGTSSAKGTRELMECWVLVPGLPPLDVYIDNKPFDLLFNEKFKRMLKFHRSPVNIHLGLIDHSRFIKMTAEATFYMCPSTMEGYGHYINQARASGAVVVTTDLSPMNELITQNETGLLIPVTRRKHSKMVMGGAYTESHGLQDVDGLVATFRGPDVCEVVREMVTSTTTEQRAAMGAKARRAYHEDTMFFARAMQELRQFARHSN
ncbi:LOW QUALITY PROTEIN: Hypothetical protein PHPALM_8661 [Phytophthora palmivora]|uniref:Glycosyl transferase family 1 domain-containing protein n=1 Tax=Phytophthora palmivora TaxID=4796 RepID=A0A2P4Y9A5_9STRA|nr:LOW QUALITY PROTEIN: Hypothetical protein PHPALM_8661 [Phytophthora palmivora]